MHGQSCKPVHRYGLMHTISVDMFQIMYHICFLLLDLNGQGKRKGFYHHSGVFYKVFMASRTRSFTGFSVEATQHRFSMHVVNFIQVLSKCLRRELMTCRFHEIIETDNKILSRWDSNRTEASNILLPFLCRLPSSTQFSLTAVCILL